MSKSANALAERPVAESKPDTTLAKFERNIESIEQVLRESNLSALSSLSNFHRAFKLSAAMEKIQSLITGEMMDSLMRLQGSALGFRTDRDDKGGYKADVIKSCLIQATLRGALPLNNEINVIAGQPYLTKTFFERVVRDFPGLSNLETNFGVPRMGNGGAVVKCSAAWRMNGTRCTLEAEIPVRSNQGQGADAILGKAKRKLLARVYDRLTGSAFDLEDGDIADGETITAADGTEIIEPSPREVDHDDPGETHDGAQGNPDSVGIISIGNVVHTIVETETGLDAPRRSKVIERWCKAAEIDPQRLADESDGSDEANAIIERAKSANWSIYIDRK